MRARPLIGLVVGLLLAAACDAPQRPSFAPDGASRADDDRLAEAALIGMADLPPGFRALPPEEGGEGDGDAGALAAGGDAFEQCVGDEGGEVDSGMRADADSAGFEDDAAQRFVTSASMVMVDADLAAEAVELYRSDRIRSCMRDLFDDGLEEEAPDDLEPVEFTSTVEDLAYFEIGDDVTAFRLVATTDLGGEPFRVVLDFVAVRKGRTTALYAFGGAGDGYPLDEQVTTANRALGRLS